MKVGFTHIIMCDGLHKRLDHSLGNLQLMASAAHHGQRIWGITEDEVIITLDSAEGLTELAIDAGATGTCSVISHSDEATGITEEGMEYGLENARVSNRALWGISNELIESPARISLRSGSMWIFLPLKEIERISYAGVKLI
jgi:thiamine pyrophosphokinase